MTQKTLETELMGPKKAHTHPNNKKLQEFTQTKLSTLPMPIRVSRTRRVTPTTSSVRHDKMEKQLPNGDLFTGSFVGNLPDGSGKYVWSDGCMYDGEWRIERAFGTGKFTWPSGATYEGDFKHGRKEGFRSFNGYICMMYYDFYQYFVFKFIAP